jgi:hypothetical protein
MSVQTSGDLVTEEVGSWPGVEIDTGEMGEVAFKLGNRELGHTHGGSLAHFSFPKSAWDQLYSAGRIEHHPVFPDQRGPAQRRMDTDADAADVIALFRLVYDRVVSRMGLPEAS